MSIFFGVNGSFGFFQVGSAPGSDLAMSSCTARWCERKGAINGAGGTFGARDEGSDFARFRSAHFSK